MITIYGGNNSRATRNLWALEEIGLPYKQDKVNVEGRSKSPEYLAINPAGKVPSMSDDNGNVAMFVATASVYRCFRRPTRSCLASASAAI